MPDGTCRRCHDIATQKKPTTVCLGCEDLCAPYGVQEALQLVKLQEIAKKHQEHARWRAKLQAEW
jgi:hypothetical protein